MTKVFGRNDQSKLTSVPLSLGSSRKSSYRSLLAELATLTRNTIRLPQTTASFEKLAEPTAIQARALELAEHAPVTA